MAQRYLSKSFGNIVRFYRSQLSLTQEALAERAGVHPTYIGMVERGERNCSLDVASGIAKALNRSLSSVIAEAENIGETKVKATNRKIRPA